MVVAASVQPAVEPEHDDVVLIRGATWADYQRLLEIRGERSVPRLAYLEGALQLVSTCRSHEVLKSMIGRLVEAWCFETGVGLTPYGSWTLEQKDIERGGARSASSRCAATATRRSPRARCWRGSTCRCSCGSWTCAR